MKLKIFFTNGLHILILAMMSGLAGADSEPELEFGVVDAIYHERSAFVVGDIYKTFDLNMKVFASDGRPLNRYALREGAKVVYELNKTDLNKVAAIWIKASSFSGIEEEE